MKPPGQRVDGEGAHRVVLAISFAPGRDGSTRRRVEPIARRALGLLCDGAAARTVVDEGDLLVLEAGRRGIGHVADDGAFVHSFGVGGTDWRRARACDAVTLLSALRAGGAAALADVMPPFAALSRRQGAAPLEAATDACGLQHVYVTAGAGFAACSSSCLALGALTDGGLDLEALARYARLNFHLGERTSLTAVRRLRPGAGCSLAAGSLRIAAWAAPCRREPRFASFPAAVDAGVHTLRHVLRAATAAHPHLGLSLSGGLDSRVVLAALLPEQRAALEAVCIAGPDSEDAAIVRRLAAQCGFAPTIVDVRAFPQQRSAAYAEAASRRRDHGVNPLSTAVLEWVESTLSDTPRLDGHNGEFARGHYFRDDPEDASVTRERVGALVEWTRFAHRDIVSLLAPAYRDPMAEALRCQVHDWLAATGLPWLDALDELYLGQRMAGWLGSEHSRTAMRRVNVSPYFDPRFLAVARRVPPGYKRGSRLWTALLGALDPALAAVPLDARPAPARTGAPPARVGADAVRSHFLHEIASGGQSLGRAAALPLFDRDALAAALRADAPLHPLALGFVLNLEWMLAFLERARG